ncbi:hypothetical protein LDENG_00272370 [Lucifuga dentata]|nr:hypothetical protein LDENG_00272370 [Lucifuga dentata]
MAWQNRMALDMLLAEQGGVCVMFGTACCTFIPNNTAPDGSITRALEGLQALSNELAENSGTYNPFTSMLESWFGKWSNLAMSFLTSAGICVGILTVCGCCIPCMRGLLQRLIDTAITKNNLVYQQIPQVDDDHAQIEVPQEDYEGLDLMFEESDL